MTQLFQVNPALAGQGPFFVRRWPMLKAQPPRAGEVKPGQWLLGGPVWNGWRSIAADGGRWCKDAILLPVGRTLVGVHARSGSPTAPLDLEVMLAAKVEAVKTLTADSFTVLDLLKRLRFPFTVSRIYIEFNRPLTLEQALTDQVEICRQWYDRGLRFFELYNEPNLTSEGYKFHWTSGREFMNWYLPTLDKLRHLFPEAYFGFPATSPGPANADRLDEYEFLAECASGIAACDFLCNHSYWQNDAELTDALKRVREKFFPWQKPIVVTEFGHSWGDLSRRGMEYKKFYQMVGAPESAEVKTIAAMAWIVSAPSFPQDAWRDEAGKVLPLVKEIGQR